METCFLGFELKDLIGVMALLISVFVFFVNRKAVRVNKRLSIQQIVFKTVIDRAKECNELWDKLPSGTVDKMYFVVSELVISIEVIDRSLELFGKYDDSFKREDEDHFNYIFWKQLRPSMRGWIKESEDYLVNHNKNQVYEFQMRGVMKRFSNHFE